MLKYNILVHEISVKIHVVATIGSILNILVKFRYHKVVSSYNRATLGETNAHIISAIKRITYGWY